MLERDNPWAPTAFMQTRFHKDSDYKMWKKEISCCRLKPNKYNSFLSFFSLKLLNFHFFFLFSFFLFWSFKVMISFFFQISGTWQLFQRKEFHIMLQLSQRSVFLSLRAQAGLSFFIIIIVGQLGRLLFFLRSSTAS